MRLAPSVEKWMWLIESWLSRKILPTRMERITLSTSFISYMTESSASAVSLLLSSLSLVALLPPPLPLVLLEVLLDEDFRCRLTEMDDGLGLSP